METKMQAVVTSAGEGGEGVQKEGSEDFQDYDDALC